MTQQLLQQDRRSAPPQGPARPGFDGSGPGGSAPGGRVPRPGPSPATTATWWLLAAVAMLFIGFTSSYLSRQAGADWAAIPMPPILWLTTSLVVASSGLLEWGRRSGRRGHPERQAAAVSVSAWLGLLFLVGQGAAWRELARAGLFLTSNPHAAFFYVLTLVHGLHILAGLIWLLVAAARIRQAHPQAAQAVASGAIFWHFVGTLWIYLWVLLFWL